MEQQSALILDGHLKSALATVRSLGMQKVAVWVGAERSTAMAGHSRYCRQRFVYPSPKLDQDGFIKSIKEAAKAMGGKPIVYAFSDATWLSLWKYREELDEYLSILWPPAQPVELAFDKGATHSEAKILGVPVVKTYLRERRVEVEQVARELSYPAVVKTRHSVAWHNGKGVFGTARFVNSSTELMKVFFELYDATGEFPLIQPFIKGEEYGVELLVADGEVIAETIHHRLRSLSPTGGASVLKETIEESEITGAMRAHAYKLVSELKWSGPVMVEFKVDSDTRQPLLMELNGRWWGSLPLAIAAGVDFPWLYHQLVNGVRPQKIIQAKAGVVTRHFLGDVLNLLRVLFSFDPMRSFLYPSRRFALREFFKLPTGTKSDVWDWHDLKPSLMEYSDQVMKLIR